MIHSDPQSGPPGSQPSLARLLAATALVLLASCSESPNAPDGGAAAEPLTVKETEAVTSPPADWYSDIIGGAGAGDGAGDSAGDGGPGLGRFRNAIVRVETVLGQTAEAEVDALRGLVHVNLGKYTGPVRMTALAKSDGSTTYFDEAQRRYVPYPVGTEMNLVLPRLDKNFGITVLTESAWRYLTTKYGAEAWKDADKVIEANAIVREEFNRYLPSSLQISDITRLPYLLGDATPAGSMTGSENAKYGAVISALGLAAGAALPNDPAPAVRLLEQMAQDFCDGVLDAKCNGSAVAEPGRMAYQIGTLSEDLLDSITQVAASCGNDTLEALTPRIVQVRVDATRDPFANQSYSDRTPIWLKRSDGQVYFWAQRSAAAQAYDATLSFSQLFTHGPLLGRTFDGKVYTAAYGIVDPSQPRNAQTAVAQAPSELAAYANANMLAALDYTQHPSYAADGLGQILRKQDGRAYVETQTQTLGTGAVIDAGLSDVDQVAVAGSMQERTYYAVLKSGAVYAWGSNANGQLGNGNAGVASSNTPLQISGLTARAVVGVNSSAFAIDRDGVVWAWGAPFIGIDFGNSNAYAPFRVRELGAFGPVARMDCSEWVSCVAQTARGEMIVWGGFWNDAVDLREPFSNLEPRAPLRIALPAGRRVISVGAAGVQLYGLLDDSTIVVLPTTPERPQFVATASYVTRSNGGGLCAPSNPPPTRAVGGTIGGLSGTVILRNNGGDDLVRNVNGPFTFSAALTPGTAYNVTVATQPSGQTCTVGNGSGTIGAADVTDVTVACAANTVTIGGTITGLVGTVVLQNNGGDDLARSSDGPFTFSSPVAQGGAYNVSVRTQPANQTCSVSNGSGTTASDVNNVAINCATTPPPQPPTLSLGYGVKQLQFSWNAVADITHYRLWQRADGATSFGQVGENLAATTTTAAIDIAVHRANWANALYYVEACNASGCTASSQLNAAGAPVGAIGYVKASNPQSNDGFGGTYGVPWAGGSAVALSADGNTLAVGAVGEDSNARGIGGNQTDNAALDAGAVYIYVRSGGTWVQQAYLKPSNTDPAESVAANNDGFGMSVALSADGNTLAVGAYGEDSSATGVDGNQNDENATHAGAVYVFTRSGTTWSQQAYIKASNTEAEDRFGTAVALSSDGNTLAVGAPREDSTATGIGGDQGNGAGASNVGAVYVFARSGTAWSQQAYVKASNSHINAFFGHCVALSSDGNTLAVGAYGEGLSPDPATSGAAFVYVRSNGVWSWQAKLKAPNPGGSDEFGTSIALSGDGNTVAVGARFEDSNATGIGGDPTNEAAADAGAAYVFARTGTTWSAPVYVKASNTGASDRFGASVALNADGSVLAVGASHERSSSPGVGADQLDNSGGFVGAAYVFVNRSGTWQQAAYVKSATPKPASAADSQDYFGVALSLSGDGNTLAVGAPMEDGDDTGVSANRNLANTNSRAIGSGAVFLY